MKYTKFMVIYHIPEYELTAGFYNTYTEARNACLGIECGLGGSWELYIREGNEYKLMEA